MSRRFSRLRYALTTLRSPNSEGETPEAPSGSVARNFQDFVAGRRRVSYTRDADSRQISLEKVSIFPFFAGAEEGTERIVCISQRALNESAVDLVITAANHIDVDFEQHADVTGFQPAKAIVSITGGTAISQTSQITGERYESRNARSFTIPYGATSGERFEGLVRGGIIEAVSEIDNATVTFCPERS